MQREKAIFRTGRYYLPRKYNKTRIRAIARHYGKDSLTQSKRFGIACFILATVFTVLAYARAIGLL